MLCRAEREEKLSRSQEEGSHPHSLPHSRGAAVATPLVEIVRDRASASRAAAITSNGGLSSGDYHVSRRSLLYVLIYIS